MEKLNNFNLFLSLEFQLIVSVILCSLWIISASAGERIKEDSLVGGECVYKYYRGCGKIASITKIAESDIPSQERYEIKFFFYPDQKITESFVQTEGKEFVFMINNNVYFEKNFLETYDFRADKIFDCILKVITKGTCTPLIFEFPFIKP